MGVKRNVGVECRSGDGDGRVRLEGRGAGGSSESDSARKNWVKDSDALSTAAMPGTSSASVVAPTPPTGPQGPVRRRSKSVPRPCRSNEHDSSKSLKAIAPAGQEGAGQALQDKLPSVGRESRSREKTQ